MATTNTVKAMRAELKRLAWVPEESNPSNAARVMSDAVRDAGNDREADLWQEVATYMDVAKEHQAVRYGREDAYVTVTDRTAFIELWNGRNLLVEKSSGRVYEVRAVWADARQEEVKRWVKGKRFAASLGELVARMRAEIAAERVRVAMEELSDAVQAGADLATLRVVRERLLAEVESATAAIAG